MTKCILPENIKDLRKAIVANGGFGGLRRMTAQQRIDLFAQYVDNQGQTDTAEWLNRQIEQRILIKNDISAGREWLKKQEQKKVKLANKEALLDRLQTKKDVFNPKATRNFAEGLAKQALGFEVSREDAKTLFDLSTTINQQKRKLMALVPNYGDMTTDQARELTGEAATARAELGKSIVNFQKKYEEINLKAQAKQLEQKSAGGKFGEFLLQLAGNIKSMKASFDVSFLRQIQNTLYVNPKSFGEAWVAGQKVFWGNPENADKMLAELLTRPNALANRYHDFGIEVGIKEEAFPESWISKGIDNSILKNINLFKRSEDAFNVSIQTARANLFDYMWEKSNGDIKLLKQQNVGKAISTITGRGSIPLLVSKDIKTQRVINNLLFAPKWLASRIETLLDIKYAFKAGQTTPEAIRGRAALGNILMIALTTALAAAWWTGDDKDERKLEQIIDPRSSDFGKLTIGRTRFDLSAGTVGLVTLLSRLITGETVTAKGKREAKTKDLLTTFARGKLSPAMQTLNNIQEALTKGKITDFSGYKTIIDFNEVKDLEDLAPLANVAGETALPITVMTGATAYSDIKQRGGKFDEEDWAEIFGVVADFVGIGANTYDIKQEKKKTTTKKTTTKKKKEEK